ncbi:MAG: Obg family GTPase CgtA [Enterobacteriaceae bacterium]
MKNFKKFIDQVSISVSSGNGGKGCISFFKLKNFKKKPSGGNGGNGGNVWLVSNSNLSTLLDFKFNRILKAENGENGKKNNSKGKNGKSLYINIPVGTIVSTFKNKIKIVNMKYDKQKFLLLKGGKGGLGNYHFRYNRSLNMKKLLGEKGKKIKVSLDLRLLSDVGLLGLPNAGKSTFLKLITNSKTKTGSYIFTTIDPFLGSLKINGKNLIIADLPGIIEGAAFGKGLGLKFLNHIKKCNLLLHIVDISVNNINKIVNNIKIVEKEIKTFDKNLFRKKRWIVFNKIDLFNKKCLDVIMKKIIKKNVLNSNYYLVSSLTGKGINHLFKDLSKIN